MRRGSPCRDRVTGRALSSASEQHFGDVSDEQRSPSWDRYGAGGSAKNRLRVNGWRRLGCQCKCRRGARRTCVAAAICSDGPKSLRVSKALTWEE